MGALRMRSRLALGFSAAALIGAAWLTSAAAASAAPVQDASELQPVIVTATGRQARIQDVPMAIQAVTASTVKNADISDLKALQTIAPSYHIEEGQSNAAGATAILRGVGTGGDNSGFESAVGFFIDGVYRNRAGVAFSELPEVERIEVLEGPQGTLYGRNTSAGAISVTTKAPEFAERGFVELTGGNYNDRKVAFALTGPLDSQHRLAGKIDGGYEKRDGYIKDLDHGPSLNDRDRWNLRGQLLWDINDSATLRLIADTAHTKEFCCSAVSVVYGSTAAAVNGVARLGGGIGLVTPPDPKALETTVSPGHSPLEKVDEFGFSGQLDWKLDNVKIIAITSYRDWKLLRDQDLDFSDLDRAYRQGYADHFKTFTEEARFQGDFGLLNWLAGGFYADETLDHIDNIKLGSQAIPYVDALAGGALPGYNVFGSLGSTGCGVAQALFPTCRLLAAGLYRANPNPALLGAYNAFANAVASGGPLGGQGQNLDRFRTHTRSAAIFTHNEITLPDDLTLTLGARFNHEDKEMSALLPPTTGGNPCLAYSNPQFSPLAAALLNSPLSTFLVLTCNPEINPVANGAYATKTSENELTGDASLRYKPSRHLMVYASYSRGYKAGGFNLDRGGFDITPISNVKPTASQLHFAPEFVNAYEVGVKSTLFGGATTLDADAYYEDVSNFQDNVFSGLVFLTKNVRQLVSRGVEANALVRPTEGLTFQAGMLYDESYFASTTDFTTPGFPSDPRLVVHAGTVQPSVPRWTLAGSLTYTRLIPQTNLRGLLYIDARFTSGYTTATINPIPQTNQGDLTLVNGRVGVGPDRGRWNIEIYARNVFNQFYSAYAFTVPEQNNHDVYPGEPRMYGATLRVKF